MSDQLLKGLERLRPLIQIGGIVAAMALGWGAIRGDITQEKQLNAQLHRQLDDQLRTLAGSLEKANDKWERTVALLHEATAEIREVRVMLEERTARKTP